MSPSNLEETIKEKIGPLLEETMEKHWGITIPQIESDLTDKLSKPVFQFYVPTNLTFKEAKKAFKAEFIKRELKLHRGNVSSLAKTLKIDRRSVHRVIRNLEIDVAEARTAPLEQVDERQEFVDQAIRTTLERYKELIQPQKIEEMYSELSRLSQNIARILPHPELTWKKAEREFERQFIAHALDENKNEISQTAKKMEIRVETLYRKIKKLGIR